MILAVTAQWLSWSINYKYLTSPLPGSQRRQLPNSQTTLRRRCRRAFSISFSPPTV